jgi:hypothetical protein
MSRLDKYSRTPRVRMQESSGRKLNPLSKLALIFGHPVALIAWLVLGFSSIFVWVFPAQSEIWALVVMRGELHSAEGKITGSRRTNMTEGGSDNRPGTPIWEYQFTFTDGQGTEHAATGYTLGNRFSEGATVAVEYRADRPDYARMEGARMFPWGMGVALVGLFPLAGLVMLFIGLRLGFKRASVLSNGKLAAGKLVEMKPTNTKINNQTVHMLVFRFEVDGQEHTCIARTHRTHLLTDDEEEQIIYNAANPAKSMPVDLLPAGLVAQDDGRIEMRSPIRMLLPLLVPAVVIAVNVAVGYWMLS